MAFFCKPKARLSLVFFSLITIGWAQLPSVSFEAITVKDGLPSNTVYFATKDRQGFMWFGTRICPTRYDGATFRSFPKPETLLVTGMAADAYNTMWLSSDRNAICSIRTNSLTMQSSYNPSFQSSPETGHFFIDSYGKGWYADMHGVNRINLETQETKHYPFRQTTYVWLKGTFIEDAGRNLWVVGSDNGLFRYDRKKDTLVCVLGVDCKDPKRNDEILFTKGCVDSEGVLWLGSYSQGLIRYDPRRDTYQTFEGSGYPGSVTCVSAGLDENGKSILWVGTTEELGVFRPEQQKYYAFPKLFANSYEVNYIFRDADNGITWICTSEGILKYHPQNNLFHQIRIPEGLVRFPVTVNVLLQDACDPSGNTFWLGLSHSGLLRWHRSTGRFSKVGFPDKSTEPEVRWIVQRADGTLWIGVKRWDRRRGGLFVYSSKTMKFINPPLVTSTHNLFSASLFAYGFFDKQQRLWIGDFDEGIRVLNEKSGKDVTPWDANTQQNLLRNSNFLNDMRMDRNGKVWLATYQGVYYADEAQKRFVSVEQAAQIGSDRHTNYLYEDKQGDLWAARWGSVTEMNPQGEIKTMLTTEAGLYDRENSGIAEDRFGNIWVGNFEGLNCYNPATKKLLRFTTDDGLSQSNTLRRIFVTKDGTELLIGQNNGFDILNVTKLPKKTPPPPLVVSSFRVHEKPLQTDFSKSVRLRPDEDAFSVDFIALSYSKLHNNRYAYFLDGFDKEWKYSGSSHRAYYTNLDPGSYTLYMKSGDAFGHWNPKPIRLEIVVLPTFYETWWFRLLLGVAVVSLLYALYRYRVQQLLRLQRVRNRISADLHDEIGSSLSGISIMGSLVKQNLQQQHAVSPFLDKMMEEVHRISGSMDDIVWSINPRNDELSVLVARMVRYASELLEAKNITYQIEVPENLEHIRMNMEKRREFYLIFKEAVNNLVKHAQCTNACIVVCLQHHHLQLTIADDGVGFDSSQYSERNGLRNLQKRAENLKGKLDIQSILGGGTTLLLRFPIHS